MTHLINHTSHYFCKCACVLQNIHTSLALRYTLLKGAAVYLAILVTLRLASKWSHLVLPLLKMYTKQLLVCFFVLFYDTSSQKGHTVPSVTKLFYKLANHHIRHQAIHKVGCQPGDCIWSL